MRQFKKWSKFSYSNSLGESIAEEEAWKAALEWVLTQKFKYNPKYNDNTEVILVEGIKRELNG